MEYQAHRSLPSSSERMPLHPSSRARKPRYIIQMNHPSPRARDIPHIHLEQTMGGPGRWEDEPRPINGFSQLSRAEKPPTKGRASSGITTKPTSHHQCDTTTVTPHARGEKTQCISKSNRPPRTDESVSGRAQGRAAIVQSPNNRLAHKKKSRTAQRG